MTAPDPNRRILLKLITAVDHELIRHGMYGTAVGDTLPDAAREALTRSDDDTYRHGILGYMVAVRDMGRMNHDNAILGLAATALHAVLLAGRERLFDECVVTAEAALRGLRLGRALD